MRSGGPRKLKTRCVVMGNSTQTSPLLALFIDSLRHLALDELLKLVKHRFLYWHETLSFDVFLEIVKRREIVEMRKSSR